MHRPFGGFAIATPEWYYQFMPERSGLTQPQMNKLLLSIALTAAVIAPQAAQAGFTKTVQVVTVPNTAELCSNRPVGSFVQARVLQTETRIGNSASTQQIIIKAFC